MTRTRASRIHCSAHERPKLSELPGSSHAEPGGDVFSRLVYACAARDVVHGMVDGQIVVKDGQHVRLDADRVKARARALARRLVARAGL
jgi:cytosine/adenosine deaminase-related metal-dependent hydrolase